MKFYAGIAALLLFAFHPDSAMAQYHTDRGAVLGGLGGALAGAAIGEHNDNAGAGALIGGATGLVSSSWVWPRQSLMVATRWAIGGWFSGLVLSLLAKLVLTHRQKRSLHRRATARRWPDMRTSARRSFTTKKRIATRRTPQDISRSDDRRGPRAHAGRIVRYPQSSIDNLRD